MGTHPIFESDFDCLTEIMVSENASMSLDDYISKTKIGKGGRGRGNREGSRGNRNGSRGNDRGGDRGRVFKRRDFDDRQQRRGNRNMDDDWQHDLYSGGRGGGSRNAAKLNVSNLDFGVTDADMEELFGEFGDLRKAIILYDRSGRSTGSAEIEFTRASDAQRALDQYNNVPLDGRAMKITMMGGNGNDSLRSRVGNRDRSRSFSPRRRGGGFRRNGSGGRGSGRGRGGGGRGGREKKEEVTQEQLDKEMDEYLNEKK